MPSAWFVKDPDSTLDYTIDWSDVLSSDDSIIDSDWTMPAGLTLVSSSFTASTTTVWISGGTNNTRYDVLNTITSAGGRIDERIIQIEVKETTLLDDLVTRLRLHLGDINPAAYRYLDKWLQLALLSAVEDLQRWWNFKYLVNYTTKEIYRNSQRTFLFDSPPEIEDQDIRPIVLKAAITIKSGDLENNAWNIGSWRDAEIAYSNIEAGKQKDGSIQRDWDELTNILKPPQRRLARAVKKTMPGYLNNPFERNLDDLG